MHRDYRGLHTIVGKEKKKTCLKGRKLQGDLTPLTYAVTHSSDLVFKKLQDRLQHADTFLMSKELPDAPLHKHTCTCKVPKELQERPLHTHGHLPNIKKYVRQTSANTKTPARYPNNCTTDLSTYGHFANTQ